MIDKQLVNLSAVAVASNIHAMPALYKNLEIIFFSYLLKKYFLHDPNFGCLRKNGDIL